MGRAGTNRGVFVPPFILQARTEEGTMLITREQIEDLMRRRFGEIPVTSFYLNVDQTRYPKEEYQKNVKTLVRKSRERLEHEGLSREGRYSVLEDFERVLSAVNGIKASWYRGFAVFTSSKNGFYQEYHLDDPVADKLVVDRFPYTRPLFAVLRMKQRYIVLLLKKDKLRAFEVYGSRIEECIDLFVSTVFSSRKNAYIFINEKKYQNRLETEYAKFLHEASNEALDLLTRRDADYIVLGGDRGVCRDFEDAMHPYLRERFAGCIEAGFDVGEHTVLDAVRNISRVKSEQIDAELAKKIRDEIGRHGKACRGVKEVLKALSLASVSVLLMEQGYAAPGYMDAASGRLFAVREDYDGDPAALREVDDIMNEAVDEAVQQGAEVRIVQSAGIMSGLDHTAALLRFRPGA